MPFSIEDKHTIKVFIKTAEALRSKKYGECFSNKNWTLSGVKTVLSKTDAIPAASNVFRVAVARARLAVLIR